MSNNAIKRGRPSQAGGFADIDLSPVFIKKEHDHLGNLDHLNPATLHSARCECAVINSLRHAGSTSIEIQAATELDRSVVDQALRRFVTDGLVFREGFRKHGKSQHTVYKLVPVK